ncbi:MAG: potassium transporter TrkG [Bacteroidia bacterium]
MKQRIFDFIFHQRELGLRFIRLSSVTVSAIALLVLSYYYGFPVSNRTEVMLGEVFRVIFIYYVASFLLRFVFNYGRWEFIRHNWLEALLTLLILFDGISVLVFNSSLLYEVLDRLDLEHVANVYLYIIKLYLLLYVLVEFARLGPRIIHLNIKPSLLLILAFSVLIAAGTIFLMMPEMTADGRGADFVTALFTATSAACVTGHIVADTATYFSITGQAVIMILMQLGGIGIVTFGMFFALFSREGVSLKHSSAMQQLFDAPSLHSAKALLGQVVMVTLTIELLGFIAVYLLWPPVMEFEHTGEKLFFSLFHSISGFCNAGFSLFSNGLYEEPLRQAYLLHIVMAGLIFFGSLGFPAIRDLFSVPRLRERMRFPWKGWEIDTRIAVYTSFALILFGMIIFYTLEKDNTLAGEGNFGKMVGALFQSVTARTAGFNTVDIGAVSVPALFLLIVLMFIGGSSASTAGGIKTSTFVIIFTSVFATIRGKKNLEIANRSVSMDMLLKAYSIVVFALSFIIVSIFLLTLTDPGVPFLQLAFEEVSAFCTVGLSTGISADLSVPGKFILIFSMFVGRVGILTLALALSTLVKTTRYDYPQAHITIG